MWENHFPTFCDINVYFNKGITMMGRREGPRDHGPSRKLEVMKV